MSEQVILDFVAEQTRQIATNATVTRGSYAQGRYGPCSDIDVLFLTVSDREPETEHVAYLDASFHRLTTSPQRLRQFVTESTQDPGAIAVLHSLAAEAVIVEDSLPLRRLIRVARNLIIERGIHFDPQDPDPIILHHRRYGIAKEKGQWRLVAAEPDDCAGQLSGDRHDTKAPCLHWR